MNPRWRVWWSLLAIGCEGQLAEIDASAPGLDALVAEHVARSGLAYADCGAVEEPRTCAGELAPGYRCLVEAFEQCVPSRLSVRHASLDAGSLPEILLIEPGDAGCVLVSFQDHSDDPHKGDYGDVLHSECAALRVGDCGTARRAECDVLTEWTL